MGREIAIIIFFSLLVPSIYFYLSWLYWLQVKEYRFDRFKVMLSSVEGKKRLFLPNKFRKPVFTQRIRNIILTALLFLLLAFVLVFNYPNLILLWLTVEVMFLFLSIFVGVIWTTLLVKRAKSHDINLAISKLSVVKPFVIGITGSYGKSTTKDFVAQLLSQKYKTFKTPENKNTEFGVARAIENEMPRDTEVFVVEMGAYKVGEIRDIAKIVYPKIGIITGIEPQHLATFGSLANIMKGKFELIDSLPRNGIAIFNYSNSYCVEMADWARKKGLKVYGYKPKIISVRPEGIDFEISFDGEKKRLFVAISGAHFVENLAAAIMVARIKNISWNQIENAIRNIKISGKTMKVIKNKSGMLVIDDSYNATPHGFEAAINYLALFKEYKKIIITPGIIELAEESKKVHKDLAQRINSLGIDRLILTSNEFKSEFGSAAEVVDTESSFKKFIEGIDTKSVVLLEGRIPEAYREILKKL